jgi:hypothetical protein
MLHAVTFGNGVVLAKAMLAVMQRFLSGGRVSYLLILLNSQIPLRFLTMLYTQRLIELAIINNFFPREALKSDKVHIDHIYYLVATPQKMSDSR